MIRDKACLNTCINRQISLINLSPQNVTDSVKYFKQSITILAAGYSEFGTVRRLGPPPQYTMSFSHIPRISYHN